MVVHYSIMNWFKKLKIFFGYFYAFEEILENRPQRVQKGHLNAFNIINQYNQGSSL